MSIKVIYDNGYSSLVAEYDGELIQLIQKVGHEEIGRVTMYEDEFEKLKEFIVCYKKNEKERVILHRLFRFFRMFFIKPYYYFVVYFQSFADGRQEMKNGVVSSFDKISSQKDVHSLEQELLKEEGSVNIILVSFQRIKNRGEKIK